MKVQLMSPPVHPSIDIESMSTMPPLAIYVLAGIAREQGYSVSVLDPARIRESLCGVSRARCITWMAESIADTDVVGISCNSFNWGMALQLVDLIYQVEPTLPVIVGGIHPTLCDEHITRTTKIRYLLRGEGERSFTMFLEGIRGKARLEDVPGLTFRRDDGAVLRKNPAPRLALSELQDLPLPAFDLMPEGVYRTLPLESSRGCKFNCTFCSIMHRGSWLSYDADWFLNRLKQAQAVWGSKFRSNCVYLVDDCFTADSERAGELFTAIGEWEADLRIVFEARATDLLDERLVKSIPRRKTARLAIGVEVGYDEGLKRIRKGLTLALIERALTQLERAGLLEVSWLSFIIGFPWEGEEECLETVHYAAGLVQMFGVAVNVNWLFLCPSDLWNLRSQYGIHLDDRVFDDPDWLNKPGVFFQAHPRITRDVLERIEDVIRVYSDLGLQLRCP